MMTARRKIDWAADSPPSCPVPTKFPSVPLTGGWAFTEYGLVHDISDVEVEELFKPPIVPWTGGVM